MNAKMPPTEAEGIFCGESAGLVRLDQTGAGIGVGVVGEPFEAVAATDDASADHEVGVLVAGVLGGGHVRIMRPFRQDVKGLL